MFLSKAMQLLLRLPSEPATARHHIKTTPIRVLQGRTMFQALLDRNDEQVFRFRRTISGGQNG